MTLRRRIIEQITLPGPNLSLHLCSICKRVSAVRIPIPVDNVETFVEWMQRMSILHTETFPRLWHAFVDGKKLPGACEKHFDLDDLIELPTSTKRIGLKEGALPFLVCFQFPNSLLKIEPEGLDKAAGEFWCWHYAGRQRHLRYRIEYVRQRMEEVGVCEDHGIIPKFEVNYGYNREVGLLPCWKEMNFQQNAVAPSPETYDMLEDIVSGVARKKIKKEVS